MKIVGHFYSYTGLAELGAWIATHDYLAALAARGHDVRVLTGVRAAPYELDGVSVQHEGNLLRSVVNGSDVCISHAADGHRAHRTASLGHTRSVRFVHGAHKNPCAEIEGGAGAPILTVFNSATLQDQSGFLGPSIVCHPPVIKERYKTGRGDHITLVNASLPKGVELFDQLARLFPARSFLAVEGAYRGQRPLWRRNLTTRPQTRRMARDVYSKTRLLLIPSHYESWGMVGIEAMCSGIPVIASDLPGLWESLDGAGIFCDPRDLDQWADAIHDLDDPQRYSSQSRKAFARASALEKADQRQAFCEAVEALG